MSTKSVAGFIGLGRMGYYMASHLRTRATCNVYNRTSSVSMMHASRMNTNPLYSIAEMARYSEYLFTCLPTSKEVAEVADEILETDDSYVRVLVDCTSGNPKDTREIARKLELKGINMLDCPVSGGPGKAKIGKLCAMVGGDIDIYREMEPLISAFSIPKHVGDLGDGHAIKAINNMLNVSQLCLASGGVLALEQFGANPWNALNAINESSGRSLMTEQRVPIEVLGENYNYGFSIELMQKDLDIAMSIIPTTSPIYPMLLQVQKIIELTVEKYGRDVDYTYVAKVLTN